MAGKDKDKGFKRDEDDRLVCDDEAGVDYKACKELQRKERVDNFPRKEDGSLDCNQLSGDDRKLCQRQSASEGVRKALGKKTEGDKE